MYFFSFYFYLFKNWNGFHVWFSLLYQQFPRQSLYTVSFLVTKLVHPYLVECPRGFFPFRCSTSFDIPLNPIPLLILVTCTLILCDIRYRILSVSFLGLIYLFLSKILLFPIDKLVFGISFYDFLRITSSEN